MRVALIPPRGLENYALRSRFHLALAIPTLLTRQTYGGMYKRAAKLGDYVVMDNGANEGQRATGQLLCDLATNFGCQEVVLPDVLYDKYGTIMGAKVYLMGGYGGLGLRKMAVLQGKDPTDLKSCAIRFADIPQITVVGIPRHSIVTMNRPAVRIEIANWIEDRFPKRFKIHLLGTNSAYLGEVSAAQKYAPHIRSVDTSMPFNYAIAHRSLTRVTDTVIRPERYFTDDWSGRIDVNLLRDNIDTLMEWAGEVGREEAPMGTMRTVSTS